MDCSQLWTVSLLLSLSEVTKEEIAMQKSLVIVLALCLISVHAFVKRDVPAAADNQNYLETIQKQLGDVGKQFNDKLKETFDPEELKKGFNDALASVTKALDDLKKNTEAPKA